MAVIRTLIDLVESAGRMNNYEIVLRRAYDGKITTTHRETQTISEAARMGEEICAGSDVRNGWQVMSVSLMDEVMTK